MRMSDAVLRQLCINSGVGSWMVQLWEKIWVGQHVEVEVLQVNRYGRGELESYAPSNQVVVNAYLRC